MGSTMSTNSFCYTTAATVTASCRRKKSYQIASDAMDVSVPIDPSASAKLEGSAGQRPSYRDARLFLLVTSTSTVTATSTSTTTTYTSTVSLSMSCVPTIYSACGK